MNTTQANIEYRDIEITVGSRMVRIGGQDGNLTAVLYVNHGETATLSSWNGKTMAGAKRWAAKKLSA